MAYICRKDITCDKCMHLRYDSEEGRMACFAAMDEEQSKREAELKKLMSESK